MLSNPLFSRTPRMIGHSVPGLQMNSASTFSPGHPRVTDVQLEHQAGEFASLEWTGFGTFFANFVER